MEKNGYVHHTVNYRKKFKTADDTCTNEIGTRWGMIKGKIKKMKDVLHGRYRYGHENEDIDVLY